MKWQTEIDQIRRDHHSGAAEVESRVLDLLLDVIGDSIPASQPDYRRWLIQISREIIAAQPSMAGLFRLVNDMLWSCQGATAGEEMRSGALAFLQGWRQHQEDSLASVISFAVDAFLTYPVIMTYSRSSTVLRALLALAERRRKARQPPLQVICSEGRPMLEGQTLASELAWAGTKVLVGIDMALFGWLSEARALAIGVDSLSSTGVVSKVGIGALMRAAEAHNIPRLVFSTTSKFLPNDYLLDRGARVGDAEEIMPASNKNIVVRNLYLELAPLHLVSAVVTEKGLLNHEQLVEELARVRICPGLVGRAAQACA